MILWAMLSVMIAVAASGLTIPLVRRQERRARLGVVEVLKAQLTEIDAQVSSGTMRDEEADGLRTEIKRRLLAESRGGEDAAKSLSSRTRGWLALAAAAALALAATSLYALFGNPTLPSAAPVIANNDRQLAPEGSRARSEIANLIGPLEAKMRAHPGDPTGWRMLGWSYMQVGRPAGAATAYARAAALSPKNADYLSSEGEALTEAAGGQVTPAALVAFRRALTVDASDPRARYFLAAYKDQLGDHAAAIADWMALLKSAPPHAPWAASVRAVIERTAREHRIDISGKAPGATAD